MEDLFEPSSDAIKYVFITEEVEEYYIANNNICQEDLLTYIQPYLITNTSINSCKALTFFYTWSHNVAIDVTLWH